MTLSPRVSQIKQTRYFQEEREESHPEAKIASVPRLLALGLTVEQVAETLDLEVEQVRGIEGELLSDFSCSS